MIGDTIYSCSCGSRKFTKLWEVRRWAGGGLGETPGGFRCAKCGKEMNSQTLSRIEELRLAREKVKEGNALLAELGELDGDSEETGLAQGETQEAAKFGS